MNGYRTIAAAAEIENVIQKSRFIGRCYPISAEVQAELTLADLRKRCWDASHHCYAYRFGENGEISRSSDDGEPSGTAGVPILSVLSAHALTNVLCVVTRYFGGILLGAGGLVRAYSAAASCAVSKAGILEMRPCLCEHIAVSYNQWARLERCFHDNAIVDHVDYGELVNIEYSVPMDTGDTFHRLLANLSGGRIAPTALKDAVRFRPFPEAVPVDNFEGESR